MKKYIFLILAIVAVVAIGGYYFLFGKKDVCKDVIPEDANLQSSFSTIQPSSDEKGGQA